MATMVGARFATWLATYHGVASVVKSMDVAPPDRETSLCWREFLGARLGTRLGLAVPHTLLQRDPALGRISIQRFIAGARRCLPAELRDLCTTPRGMRILMLDIVARNPDRRPENVLVLGDAVFPIDFNVAFNYAGDTAAWCEMHSFVSRSFQLDGIGRLLAHNASIMIDEARRAEHLLTDAFLTHVLREIDRGFISGEERDALLVGLQRRRNALVATLQRWWDETITPLQRLLPGGIS